MIAVLRHAAAARSTAAIALRGATHFFSQRAAKVQEVLASHPGITRCVAWEQDQTMHAAVVPAPGALFTPWQGMHGNASGKKEGDTLIDYIHALLHRGELKKCAIVTSDNALPAVDHERVVLSDFLEAMYKNCDDDGDGKITPDEMSSFLKRHGLEHLSSCVPQPLSAPMTFGDFKNFLLSTSLVNLDADALAEYVVSAPLVSLVTAAAFDVADKDSDGTITVEELETVFANHGMGDAAAARKALLDYDDDASGTIDKDEYQRLLLGEGLLSVKVSPSGSSR